MNAQTLPLPILSRETDILKAVRENQVVVVLGETGSGKTTQIPIMLYRAGYGEIGMIGITEPRRIAATSVAQYVASLMPGEEHRVGHKVRFDDITDPGTHVKFMTDGILLKEFEHDNELSKYSVLMVDEAHERNQNIDFILGLLKLQVLPKRPEFRLVITSATIDAEKFSKHFGNAPIVEVSGRVWPVEKLYFDVREGDEIVATAQQILKIHKSGKEGDVLTFVPGKSDISKVIEILHGSGKSRNMQIVAAYGGMDTEVQNRIFENPPEGVRKVVVATNVAETAITIDGVRHVVDSGLVKESHFNERIGIPSLDVCEHSRSGCDQRAGRAGRTQNGTCYRMYSEENYNNRPLYTVPEICRMSIAGVILSMRLVGIVDVEHFPFVDPPNRQAFYEAYRTLIALGAILPGDKGLTDLGIQMAQLPLEPRISRMLIEAKKYGCVEEIATVAAFSSVRVFLRPPEQKEASDLAHKRFESPLSDALTFLNVWNVANAKSFDEDWCMENFLSHKALLEVQKIRTELLEILNECGIKASSSKQPDLIRKCVAYGLVNNLLRASKRGKSYYMMFGQGGEVFLHPGSSVHDLIPRFAVAGEIITTTKTFARLVTKVEPNWLPELMPGRFSLGERTIVAYKRGKGTVNAKRYVMQRNHRGEVECVGAMDETITLDEARVSQKKLIAQAEAEGLKEVTIKVKKGRRNTLVAHFGGEKYWIAQSTRIELQEGGHYYAKLCKEKIGNRMEFIAEPRYPVFDLGDKEQGKRKGKGKKQSRHS